MANGAILTCDARESNRPIRFAQTSAKNGDAFGKVLDHIDGGACLAVWLTCKAFNVRRPAGTCTTSVRAVCATPAMLDWAVGIGFQPHTLSPPAVDLVLKTLRDFGTSVCSIKLL